MPEQRLSESPFNGFPEASQDSVSVVAMSAADVAASLDVSVSEEDLGAALDMKVLTKNTAGPHNSGPPHQEGQGDHHRRETLAPTQSTFTRARTKPKKFADYVP
ncbi:hypothetical protein PR048_010256 [Dryococelus australis]|uniref:Uncharacterized protein n=1 Tax=Dryococelus australis TaxID=614101 RepID=A0ABQ9I268_9NEOP|nr:hypothetical protein PR048_010256 [Dryococelus australis]